MTRELSALMVLVRQWGLRGARIEAETLEAWRGLERKDETPAICAIYEAQMQAATLHACASELERAILAIDGLTEVRQ